MSFITLSVQVKCTPLDNAESRLVKVCTHRASAVAAESASTLVSKDPMDSGPTFPELALMPSRYETTKIQYSPF